MESDEKNLQQLATFHYLVAGLSAIFALFPLIHVVLGWTMIVSPEKMMGKGGLPPPQIIGWLFFGAGLAFVVMGFTFAASIFVSARKLARREGYWFSFVVACIECIFMPFGTVLGIFTIIVLSRDSVKRIYGLNNGETAS